MNKKELLKQKAKGKLAIDVKPAASLALVPKQKEAISSGSPWR